MSIIIEKGATSYGAYVPDLPGCVAVGETQEEVEQLIKEAIEFHIEGLKEDGEEIPEPRRATVATVAPFYTYTSDGCLDWQL